MIVHYVVLYEELQTGRIVEYTERDFTKNQAISAADAVVSSPWVTRAWVEKRTYDFVSQQTIHITRG